MGNGYNKIGETWHRILGIEQSYDQQSQTRGKTPKTSDQGSVGRGERSRERIRSQIVGPPESRGRWIRAMEMGGGGFP
jgi:hypothetical protein